jgi:oligopeptide transport system substrate-binding protein
MNTPAFLLLLLTSVALAAPDQTVRYAIRSEPPQLNSMKTTDSTSAFILGHVMEGLTRYGKDGQVIPGVAESWAQKGGAFTFKLRKNALWSDGKPVTAADFVFAWRTAVDPKTASAYAFALFPLKNAEAINQGKLPSSELGVKAVDERTLEAQLDKPCPYFLSLVTLFTFLPAREDFHVAQGERYGAESVNLLYNGPFVLTKWTHGSALRMERNPKYWNAAQVKLQAIDIPYITPDDSARFNFFKTGSIDVLERLTRDDLPKAQAERYKLRTYNDGAIVFLDFNYREGRPTRNASLRKAITAAIDRDEYVKKVIGVPGTTVSAGLVPSWVPGAKGAFRAEHPLPALRPNPAEARKLLAQALQELKLGAPPTLTLLIDDNPTSGRDAEYFQSRLKSVLGMDVKIDKQIFKQRLAKSRAGEFDLVQANWLPDYRDPMTFLEIRASWNEANRARYANDAVDSLLRQAQGEPDPRKRSDLMARAEKTALDDAAMLPLYERRAIYLVSDRVEGVARNTLGPDPDFTFARVVK